MTPTKAIIAAAALFGLAFPALAEIDLSGSWSAKNHEDAMERGADNYLIKDSVDGNRIAIAVLSAMRDKSAEKQSVL